MTRELYSTATGSRWVTFLPSGGNRQIIEGGICMSSRAEALGPSMACGLAGSTLLETRAILES